jgi:23S rRNA pseudouridine2605 synthase
VPGQERLQKILARTGHGSRRQAEEIIAAGRVRVDGRVAKLGDKADPDLHTITVDGEALHLRPEPSYLVLNKPTGYMCSRSDPHHERFVYELLPDSVRARVLTVGRLDIDSEGLLILTDDGELAHRLTHPSYAIPRTYHVIVQGPPDAVKRMAGGIELEDGRAKPLRAVPLGPEAGGLGVELVLAEGKKREVRRLCEAVGLKVVRLTRTSFGPLGLGHLKSGQWRWLKPGEIEALRKAVKLDDEDE